MKGIRIIALILCLMMLIPFAVACDSGNTPQDTTTAAQTPSTAEPTPDTQPTETTESSPETTVPAESHSPETSTTPETDKYELPKLKVLFVGNSFTYYNDMPQMFRELVRSYGGSVTVTSVTKGAYFLSQFNDETDEYGAKVASAIKAKYDVIFIQEQSMRPCTNAGFFYDAVRTFAKKVEPYGSRVILYETWGYKADHNNLKTYGFTTSSMESLLRSTYTAIGEEMGMTVSYAGAAMQYVYDTYGDKLDVYHTDSKHPSAIGSYLIACTHFATLYGVSPVGISYTGGLTAAQAKQLQEAAEKIASSDPTVGIEKLSSVGVTGSGTKPTDPNADPNMSYLGVDMSKTVNLTEFPKSELISVISGDFGTQKFSGILGDSGKNSSTASGTTLTADQLADLADIRNGVSVIGVHEMTLTDKSGYAISGLGALCNGHWGSSWMANWSFDTKKYDVSGNESSDGKYVGLITLNFGKIMTFDAIGYFSGSMQGFPQTADVYVSDDGVNWTLVPSACYDAIEKFNNDGSIFTNLGKTPGDPWNSNTASASCLFSMEGVSGKYIRIGVIKGRGESGNTIALVNATYQLINTRELVVYGKEK